MRTYHELIMLPTFEERFLYLKLNAQVGEDTFGFDRWLNQQFYTSKEWRDIRNFVITRDYGCDLAMPGHEIPNGVHILVHHMNPISKDDVVGHTDLLLNPDYLISTIKSTHDAIHYGTDIPKTEFNERTRNDTIPWR